MRKTIGHYEIVSELGRGGMGIVYKGFEPALNRHVAIKTLADHLAADPGVVERFKREARSMAQLSDAHIVQIYMVGEDQGQPYFAMEFVEGESLADRLKREGRIEAVEARRIIMQSAQGLAVAHETGVIHRDIKPGNLLLTKRGVVKVADFGIALATTDIENKLTGTGQFVGTPGYLSPEICLGKPSDRRSDIFSLGIVLFEMLTGRMPFIDESPLGLMLSVVQSNLPDVRELASDVDEYTVEILAGMVAKDLDARYQSCEALVEALLAAGTPYHSTHSFATPTPSNTPAATSIATALPKLGPTAPTMPVPPPHTAAVRATTPMPAQLPNIEGAPPPAPPAAPPSAPVEVVAAAAPRKRRSAVLPIAVAALLLVGIASGAGYLWISRSAEEAATSFAAAYLPEPVPLPAAAAPPEAGTSTTATETAQGGSVNPGDEDTTPAVSAAPAALADTPAEAPAETPEAPDAATPVAVAAGSQNVPATPSTSGNESSPAGQSIPEQAVAQVADTAAAPAAAASDSRRARLGEKIAAAREGQAALRTNLATAAPERAPEPVARPLPARVLVVARGDPAITGPAQALIEEALYDAGVDIADLDLVPGLDRYAADNTRELMAAVARSGAASAIVVINVVPVGSQELTYYGEVSTLYTAQIRVRAYSVARREAIGRPNQAKVSFTSLNADFNTRQALEPMLDRMVSGVHRQIARR